MIYKAYLEQKGEGCDYTIACGKKVISIVATTDDEARKQIYNEIKKHYRGDSKLLTCELYKITEIIQCNVKEWYKTMDYEDQQDKIKEKQEKLKQLERYEYKEYLKLKAKFEGI